MLDVTVQQGIECLKTLRNADGGDGGWGQYMSGPSRATNTAEAVWALCLADPDQKSSLDGAIRFLEGAIDGSHRGAGQICQHARDYAWALLALHASGHGVSDAYVGKCLDWLLDNKHRTRLGGWSHPSDPAADATQPTALAITALQKVLNSAKDANDPTTKQLTTNISDRIRDAVDSLERLRSEQEGGWGKVKGWKSDAAYTAFALVALASCEGRVKDTEGLEKGRSFLLSQLEGDHWANTEEPGTRTDKIPYRHFTTAWALIALSQKDSWRYSEQTFRAAAWLIKHQHKVNLGWTGETHVNGATTWGTAHAVAALVSVSAHADFSKTIEIFESARSALEKKAELSRAQTNIGRELSYVWSWKTKPLFAVSEIVFVLWFVVYLLVAVVVCWFPPSGVSRLWPLALAPVGIAFFAYSFWRQHLKVGVPTSIAFIVGLLGLAYALILGIWAIRPEAK